MKIYVDVSVLTLATYVTGIQRVTMEILVRMIRERKNELILLHYHGKDDCYYRIDHKLFINYYAEGRGRKHKMITRQRVEIGEIGGGDVFFDLDAAWMGRVKRSYLLPILKKQGAKIIAHIYDVISLTHPQYCLQRGVYYFMDYFGAHLQYADCIITNAEATVEELKKIAEKLKCQFPKCYVIPLGADFHLGGNVTEKDITDTVRRAAEKPYVLMVGTIEPRKNHKLLLNAYDIGLKEIGYQIIFAGAMGWNMEDFSQKLKEHPDYQNGIFHFEGLDDRTIGYLYEHAKFLAFCSYTEGYGLPLIEGIMRGTPVLATDIPVSREVAGDYCEWFEQDNEQEMINIIKRYTEAPKEYEEWKERLKSFVCFSWDMSYEEYKKVLIGMDK